MPINVNKKRILIVDALHPIFKERAINLGYEVDDMPNISREETLAIVEGYHGIAVRTKFSIDKEILEKGNQLQFVARAGAGLDNIDVDFAKTKGIQLINAPEGNSDAVGEHAMAMLLSLLNNIEKGNQEIRNGVWDREGNRGVGLKDKTIGLIGYGHMGQSFAQKLTGFGVRILAYDKYKTGFSDSLVTEVSMEEIVKHVDILSLHIPLTKETRGMVNEEYLFHFRRPIYFINTARGEIVETQALLNALQSGKILGAGLDVLEVEKFPKLGESTWFESLRSNKKVILTPHVGGWTRESYVKISEVLADKLQNLVF